MTITRTTREVIKPPADPRAAIIQEINTAMRELPVDMTPEAWIIDVMQMPGVEEIRCYQSGIGGGLCGALKPSDGPFTLEGLEPWFRTIASGYGGGTYLLRPIHRGIVASGRSFPLGSPGSVTTRSLDARSAMSNALEIKATVLAGRELDRMAKGEDDGEMKPKDMMEVITLVKSMQPPAPTVSGADEGTKAIFTLLMDQNRQLMEILREKPAAVAVAAPSGLGAMFEKAVEPLLGRLIDRAFAPAQAGIPALIEPEKGFLDHLTDFGATPMGQQIGTGLANLAMRMATPAVPVMGQATATVVQPPTAMLTPGQEAIPVAPPQIPPEIKAILEAFIAELGRPEEERDIEGLAAFLQGTSLGELSLWDRFEPYFRMPDRLRPLSLRLLDPRFVDDAAVAAGMAALIEYGRKLQAEPEA